MLRIAPPSPVDGRRPDTAARPRSRGTKSRPGLPVRPRGPQADAGRRPGHPPQGGPKSATRAGSPMAPAGRGEREGPRRCQMTASISFPGTCAPKKKGAAVSDDPHTGAPARTWNRRCRPDFPALQPTMLGIFPSARCMGGVRKRRAAVRVSSRSLTFCSGRQPDTRRWPAPGRAAPCANDALHSALLGLLTCTNGSQRPVPGRCRGGSLAPSASAGARCASGSPLGHLLWRGLR